MGEQFLIIISTCLVNNLVLDFMLGTDPLIAVSKKASPAYYTCLLLIMVMPLVSLCMTILDSGVLIPFQLEYLRLLSTIMLVSVLVLLTANIIRIYKPRLYILIAPLIPLIMVDCTLLGFALLAGSYQTGLIASFFYGLGSALGFSLVLLALTPIRARISVADVPVPFRGVSILLITLGLISMAFMGFDGLSAVK